MRLTIYPSPSNWHRLNSANITRSLDSTLTGDPQGMGFESRSRSPLPEASRVRPEIGRIFMRPHEDTITGSSTLSRDSFGRSILYLSDRSGGKVTRS